MKKWFLPLLCGLLAACGSEEADRPDKELRSLVCNITAPRNGAEVPLGEPLSILGTAYVQGGRVVRTELRVGGEKVDEVVATPFTCRYALPDDAEPGPLTIVLEVESDWGAVAVAEVTVTMTTTSFSGAYKPEPTVPVTTGSMTDPRDGNVYGTVTLGDQVWFAENLRYMPEQHTTLSLTEPRYYSLFDEDVAQELGAAYLATFGAYYNRPAILQGATPLAAGEARHIRGVCPEGWHIPSIEEWSRLGAFVVEAGVAAIMADGTVDPTACAKALASDNSDETAPKWLMPDFIEIEEQPTWVGVLPEWNNALRFNGIPAGYRACIEQDSELQPIWDHLCYSAGWWSASAATKMEPYERFGIPVRMWSDLQTFVTGDSEFRVDCALPVRCLRD